MRKHLGKNEESKIREIEGNSGLLIKIIKSSPEILVSLKEKIEEENGSVKSR